MSPTKEIDCFDVFQDIKLKIFGQNVAISIFQRAEMPNAVSLRKWGVLSVYSLLWWAKNDPEWLWLLQDIHTVWR